MTQAKLLQISKYKIKPSIKEFFFDGCHKIYIIEDENDKKTMFANRWTIEDIHPLNEIQTIFANSCPLRFINTCKLQTVVKQAQKQVKFIYNNYIIINKL